MDLRSRTVFGMPPPDAQEALDSLVMTWAHDRETGRPVYIMELGSQRNGNNCRCTCPSCGHDLTAVNAGKAEGTYVRRPHFRHRTGVVKDLCLVLTARSAALRLLAEEGMIDLPSRTRTTTWHGLSGAEYQGFAQTPAEQRALTRVQFRDSTSAVLTLDDGRQVVVYLTGTNIPTAMPTDGHEECRATIFIAIDDPRVAGLSPSELRARLRIEPELLCWRTHWDDGSLEQQATSRAMARAQEMLDWPETSNSEDLEAIPTELRRETLLHYTVKQILAESGRLQVPELKVEMAAGSGYDRAVASAVLMSKQAVNLRNPRLEHRLGNVIPDVCADALGADGNDLGLLCIEVTVTNEIGGERLERVRRENHLTLEIDLRESFGRVTRAELAALVTDKVDGKRWLNHPNLSLVQDQLRASALAASEEMAQRRRQQGGASHEEARNGSSSPNERLPPPYDDLERVRAAARDLDWIPTDDLLDGLVSLRHGIGLGRHDGRTAAEVALKLRHSMDSSLHCLVLIALGTFGHGAGGTDFAGTEHWAALTRQKMRARDSKWLPPAGALEFLKEFFPELAPAVDKMIRFIGGPRMQVNWTTGAISAARIERADALRRNLYRNGAYRYFAPRINYDRVIAEAREARSRNADLGQLLTKWSKQYALGEDLKPIIDVLREAGLVI